MQPMMPSLRDPAPSRLRYRMQRWMLTPGIRLGLRLGVPLALILGAGGAWLADGARREALTTYVDAQWQAIQQRPEFMVNLVAIDGAAPPLADHIRGIIPVSLPVSSFDLDLEAIRQTVLGLNPVQSAQLRIRPGGVLQIEITERTPAILWRSRTGLEMLDETGARIYRVATRASHAELPLIVGDGADAKVAEALALIDAAAPLGARLRGLVRIGERRWDVVLDREQRILLPETEPVRALERVIALSEIKEMLERDVAVVDMRLSERPTLRMSAEALQDW